MKLEQRRDYFPAGTKFRPLRDQIIVKPLGWQPSTIIEIAGDKRKPLRGVVVAVGPGQRQKKYWRNAQGQRCKVGETGVVIPISVKPGDVVELGGLERDGISFPQIVVGTEPYLLCQEQDVCFIHEAS